MKTSIKSQAKSIFQNIFPWLILFLTYSLSILFFHRFGRNYLDADMASEMVLADILKSEHSILSVNWFYSTELRIVNQSQLFKFLLYLFPNNWHLVRTLSQAILLGLTALAYLFMMSAGEWKRESIYFASILMCPFGFWYMFHGTFDGFYLTYMIFIMISVGLVNRLLRSASKHKKISFLILLSTFAFLFCLQGVRMLMNLYIPLILTAVLLLYCSCRKADKNGSDEFSQRTSIHLCLYGLILFFSAGIGYLINSKILIKSFPYITLKDTVWLPFSLQNISQALSAFFELFGYATDDFFGISPKVFSLAGICATFGILFILILIVSMIRIIQNFFTLNMEQKFLSMLFYSMLFTSVLIFSCLSAHYNGSYYLPMMPLAIALLQIEFETETYSIRNEKKILAWIIAIIIICCSFATSTNFLKNPPRSNSTLPKMVEVFQQRGYQQGIAQFWESNVITELSNGQIEMWTVEEFTSLNRRGYLQTKSHTRNLPQGKCLVLYELQNYNITDITQFQTIEVLWLDDDFVALGFQDINELYQYLAIE